jgi:hypothetical protein
VAGSPKSADSTTTSTTASPTTTSATPSATAVNVKVCKGGDGLEWRGRGFYPTYKQLMQTTGQGMAIQPVELAAQLAGLTTIGAEGDEIDGSAMIDKSSPEVRLALTRMIRDADRLAQHFVDVSNGAPAANPDMTAIVNSFTDALIACSKAGQQPSWFKPEELTGR